MSDEESKTVKRNNNRNCKRSQCWYFYNKTTGGGFCKVCNKEILTQAGGTTNLRNHLRRKHGELWFACMENRLDTDTLTILDHPITEAEREPPDFTEDGSHQNQEETSVAVHTLQAYTCEDGRTVLWLKPAGEGDQEIEIQNGHIEPVIAEEGETAVTNGETHDSSEKETTEPHESEVRQGHQSEPKPQEVAPSPKKYISTSSFLRTVPGSSYNNKTMLRKVARPSPIARPSSDTNSSNRDDTFDHFGKYIASLLRSLPSRKVACRLQGEMINWIMKEQMKLSDS